MKFNDSWSNFRAIFKLKLLDIGRFVFYCTAMTRISFLLQGEFVEDILDSVGNVVGTFVTSILV